MAGDDDLMPVLPDAASEQLRQRLAVVSPSAGDPELAAVLVSLLAGSRAALGPRFVGLYLQGSLAVGDFDEDSDVDFVVALRDEVTDGELAALQRMHDRVYRLDSRWAQHLEGAYLPLTDLRQFDPASSPHLFLDHGSRLLERSDHDHSVLFRYVLREHGVVVAGPDPKDLIDPIPAARLAAEARANLPAWFGPLLDDAAPLDNRWMQAYSVLTVCRMLHTARHGAVVSKRTAVAWATEALDPEWRGLIQKAWQERPESFLKARQRADPSEAAATVAFIRHILGLSAHDV
jgi:hypothetical protein